MATQQQHNKKLAWPSTLKSALKVHLKAVQSDYKMPLIEESPPNSVLAIVSKVAALMPRHESTAIPATSTTAATASLKAEEGTSVKAEPTDAPADDDNFLALPPPETAAVPPATSTAAAAAAEGPTTYSSETIATLVDFLLDLFEQCCLCNLLTLEERRTFQFIVLGKQTANGRQQKKRRTEDPSVTPVLQRLVYSSVLTVEYLLRLLAALPILVHHYRVLCSGISTSHPVNQSRSVVVGLSQPITASSSGALLPATDSTAPKGPSDGCEALWDFANAILKYISQHPTILTPLSKYAPFVEE